MKTDLLFSSFPFAQQGKVTLHGLSELDIPALWGILGDEDNFRYMPNAAPSSPEECKVFLRQANLLFQKKDTVTLGIYANNQENRLAGILKIYQVSPKVEAVSLSFMLNPEYAGLGLASDGVRCAVSYLMDTIGVHRIQCWVLPINYRGILVLERCGFQKEGLLRDGEWWPDKGIVDICLYSLLPTDLNRHGGSDSPKNYYL